MPEPKPNETRDEWMERCVPYMVERENRPQDQAVAMCSNLWESRDKSMDKKIKFFQGEIKAYDDEEMTIEHFITTEKEDRSKDTVLVDGIKFDGVPSVLKQHGFDADVGSEPIAKPLSITIATDKGGNKGLLVKTQYYDGSKLVPPDNTGRRLYEKAKDGYMPYWSIGFIIEDAEPKSGGGLLIKECTIFEYSQVGVPDNISAAVVKSWDGETAKKQADKLISFEIKAEEVAYTCVDCGNEQKTVKHCTEIKCEKCGGEMRRKERPGPGKEAPKTENKETEPEGVMEVKQLEGAVEREINIMAVFTVLDEFLYQLGRITDEKGARKLVRELAKIIEPYAIGYVKYNQPSEETKNKFLADIYKKRFAEYVSPEPGTRQEKDSSESEVKPPVLKWKPKPKKVLKLKREQKPKTYRLNPEHLKQALKDTVSENVRNEIRKLKGKVD